MLATAAGAGEPWRVLGRLAGKMGAEGCRGGQVDLLQVGSAGPQELPSSVSHGPVVLALVGADARHLRHLERLYFAGMLAMELPPGHVQQPHGGFIHITITRARRDHEQATRPVAP